VRPPSSSSPAVLRQEHKDRLRRDRAAAPSLRVAFPSVQQLRLELKFASTTTNIPASQSHVLHPPARAFFEFPCPYADCDGQFDLTAAVDLLLADRTSKAEGTLQCQGHRPDRRATRTPCQLQLTYEFTVTYSSGR
jgi:hypothetical protein